MSEKIDWTPSDQHFGELLLFIKNRDITDIDINAELEGGTVDVWVRDMAKGMKKLPPGLISIKFVEQFCNLVANTVNKPFNPQHVSLEADTEELRISILHESVTTTGRCICIRKSPPFLRNTITSLIQSGFCEKETLALLANCVISRQNLVVCGVPGAGKTEFLKFLTQFIEERVAVIEDNPEIHYKEINSGKSCVSIRVVPGILEYSEAIQKALRYDTEWILLSEARGREARELIEAWSTGTHGITTIHAEDVRKLPDRIQSMVGADAERLENKIYSFLNTGILIRKKRKPDGGEIRILDQLGFFVRNHGQNSAVMVVEDGELKKAALPEELRKRFRECGIEDPFFCVKMEKMIEEETGGKKQAKIKF